MNVYSQLIKAKLEQTASDLAETLSGLIWHNTTSKKLKFYDGVEVKELVDLNSTQTLTNKVINADSSTITNIDNADIKALAAIDATKIANGTVDNTKFQHINTLSSNAQTQITSGVTATALVQTNLTSHLNDTVDAHDASAISVTPSGAISSTDVQAALVEIQGDITAHIDDTLNAHFAGAIEVSPTGNLAADDVQEALVELQEDIDTINTDIAHDELPDNSPSLLLDFANSKTLDHRITFTRASTATFVNAKGLIETAAINAPRFDHDPTTLESLGLLIEEGRTNLFTYSEQFDNAAWNKVRSTISANATTAPDGSSNADKITEDASAATDHYMTQSFSVVSGTTYSISVFLKAAGRNFARLRVGGAGFVGDAYYDLINGICVSTGASTATIKSFPNGWYLCQIATLHSVTETANVRISTADSLINPIVNGDSVSGLYVWGAQHEVGAFPTSYIPTTTAAVTRSVDLASMTGTNFSSWYNQSEGTIIVKSDITGKGTDQTIFAINDNSQNEQIDGRYTTALVSRVRDGGVDQATLVPSASTPTVNTIYTLARSYKLNDFAASANGDLVVTDASGNIPTVTQLELGARVAVSQLNGHIFNFYYYPKRLSNAELQAVSTQSTLIGTAANQVPTNAMLGTAAYLDENYVVQTNSSGNVGIGTSSPDQKLHVYGTSTTAIAKIETPDASATAITRGMAGLELVSKASNTTSKYFPAIKFMSSDNDLTTENPKLVALIAGRAFESYTSDTQGAAGIDFATTGYTPGAASVPTVKMTIDPVGKVGIGNTAPQALFEVSAAADPTIRLSEASSTTSYMEIIDASAQGARINKVSLTGSAFIDLNPVVTDLVSNTQVRLFRDTNTAGIKVLQLFKGDGTGTTDAQIAVLDNSYFNITSGNVGMGIATPTAKVHIDKGNATASALKLTAGTTTGTTATDGFDIGITATGVAEIRQRENLDMVFYTNNTEVVKIANDGVLFTVQPAQTSKAAAATLTATELRTGIVQYTGASAALTLPTGTDLQTSVGTTTNISFDFSVINTGAGTATMTTNTGWTLVGTMTVATLTTGQFRARRTGTNTFTLYRIA